MAGGRYILVGGQLQLWRVSNTEHTKIQMAAQQTQTFTTVYCV